MDLCLGLHRCRFIVSAVYCPALTAPANGGLSSEGPNSYPDAVTFTCNQGYELDGTAVLICQDDQAWSAPVPICQPVHCPAPTAPANGGLSSEGPYYYQDVVTFTCNRGYELTGASSVSCQANETWSDDVPTCIFTACVPFENLALTDLVPEGYIMSPFYPGNYPNNADCSWTITAPSTTVIQLDFVETFDIETGLNCPYDYVQVIDGQISFSPVLGRLCGTTLPPTLRTTGNAMTVQFHTDYSEPRAGFKAKYSMILPCLLPPVAPTNGALSPEVANYYQDGVITFSCNPGYDLNGASNVTCQADQTWSHPSPTCTLTAACVDGQNLALTSSAPEGYILSPNYPDNYLDNMDCSWTITAPSAIQLDFVETFDIESGDNCPYDYVQVLEGPVSSSPVLGKFCGNTPPPTLRTTGNVMTVQFHTDRSVPRAGFKAKYSIAVRCPTLAAPVNGALAPVGSNYYQDVVTFTCNQGYELNGASNLTCQADTTWSDAVPTCQPPEGYIVSPNYPGNYPINIDCSWTITAPSAIQLDFLETFDIGPGTNCQYDYVQVLEGAISFSPVLGKFCGATLPPTMRTFGNVMTVQFHTDHSISSTGFKAKYSMALPCRPTPVAPTNGALSPERVNYYQDDVITFSCNPGYDLNGASNVTCQADQTWSGPFPTCTPPEGYIMSPNYPNNYPNFMDCSWTIFAPSASVIQLDFVETFDIEPGLNISSCTYDYVQVLEGQISTSPVLGTFCGAALPPTLWTVGNVMTVKFHTDGSVPRTGFKAKYSMVSAACVHGETLTLTDSVPEGYIMSPNYPGNYPNNADCSWIITAPSTTAVQLDFVETFDIEYGANCLYDYVQVLEDKYCGATPPPTLRTVGNVMTVQFHTDYSEQRAGFKAKYSIAVQCPTLTAPANGALSPTGTNSYQDVVTFTCNQGYELNGTSNLTCQADQMWSDSAPTCTLTACVQGENLALTDSVTEGYIMSPNYPDNYPSNADCSWTITAPSAIQLDFVTFDVELQQSCRYDYVRVLDGRGSASPTLGKFCGATLPPTVRTVGNVMTVKFRSDGSTQRTGFRAKYSIVIQCPAQTAPANGALSPEVANYYQDDVITFTCNQGYELNGASNVTCKNDTTWSHPVPTCTRKTVCSTRQCPTLAAPVNGALTPVGANSYQDLVTFTCDLGYELDGASSVTCHADQTWSAPVPICQPVQCPSLTAPANGLLTPVGANSYQDVVTFTCNHGYELAGASSVICQADQTWSQHIPTCTQIVITTTMTTTESVSTTLSETTATTTEPTTTEPKTTLPETTVTTTTTEPTTAGHETTLPETTAITTTELTTTLPETTMMTTSTEPTTTMPETTLPETTSATATTTPTTTVPETTLPDTTVPETTVPETALPETTIVTTTTEPTTTVPETTIPETTIPETTVPEITLPDTTVPETTLPETTIPETTIPETTLPETTEPEITLPETMLPETTLPETTVPEATVPETTPPETTLPETTLPETTLPETTPPETTLPETALPETTVMTTTTESTTTLPETTPSETGTLLTTESVVTIPETTATMPTTESTPTVPETTTNKTWATDSSSTMLDTTYTSTESASVKPTEQLSTKHPEATKPVPTEAPTIVQKTDFVFTTTTKSTEKPVNANTEKPKPKPTEPPKEDEPESSSSSQVVIIAGAAGGGAAAVAGGCACVIMIRRRKLLAGSQKREELELMDLNNAKE
ncbi:PREDICTED: CUB and sushi domain-containing protein 1-like [Branchiostoma belcheri]|uniref:CUB and sushi domain-containing protein 1-like n=1 Tax=Branchiostoma belcheri TaxID=7741 RepID=A0A6P5AF89_BRABE|nr:PREDICTED: CUB and sushi domain-containing protein 1-like [Branchiostoma belcheri]